MKARFGSTFEKHIYIYMSVYDLMHVFWGKQKQNIPIVSMSWYNIIVVFVSVFLSILL